MDFQDMTPRFEDALKAGAQFVIGKVEQSNLAQILSQYVSRGDVLIDLAWNIDANVIIEWCHDNGVLYLNTSVEEWDPYESQTDRDPRERTLLVRHQRLQKMKAAWTESGPTAVVEHGANPGLVSHFVKRALADIAAECIAQNLLSADIEADVRVALAEGNFPRLAHLLTVKVIHVSERDTQVSDQPKLPGEFVNTWSIEGFREEGTTTSEMGWGTHEKTLPKHAFQHKEGPKNQICLAQMGINVWVRSFVPDNWTILGMVVRHGEAFTISDKLTVWKKGKAVYRPTMHYAYCPCDEAISSLNEMRGYNYKLNENQRIMNDEITSGADVLGALIMGHDYNSWWVGSDLSIEESRRLVPHQNATTMQVAISVVAASMWMIENPAEGVVVPDELPHDYVLKISKPYLGRWISKPYDWTPLKGRDTTFDGFNKPDLDRKDPWQFKNFLVTDAG